MWLRRTFLFVVTNILVMATLMFLVNLLGLQPYLNRNGIDYFSLMIFCLFWGFGGAFISLLISRWMAKMSMGVQVLDPENPGGSEERWLVDTVHRLAQKAGLTTMPEVGIYKSPDPNAFATGPGKDSALVAVSSGLFTAMNHDQIESVLGHEMTHITNGDMVTMTLVQGVVNSFVFFLAWVFSIILTQGGNNDRRGNNYMAQFFIRQILQVVLGLLGFLVVMWFSRWREFRADAGGARLTSRHRMADALRGLQKYIDRPKPAEPASLAAFKISAPGGNLFASHPPLEVRIARLESGSDIVAED
ncbi:MAG TPA: protease HtpX [bacterium]|nr:protease HtpX [bacterium]